MFSQKVEYALRAVIFLANEGEPRTIDRVAEVTHVPGPYLAKLVQEMVRLGLLRSQRGVGGGISLVKRPAELTLLEVVNAVDPIPRIRTCPLGIAAHGARLCPLHAKLDKAAAELEAAFASTTLADLLAEPNPSVPLCHSRSDRG
ncbi:MAG: Rrf2 family transcriptional regulator [Gemmataceae bacterium]